MLATLSGLALLAVASAMPSYIAVPAEQIAFLDLRALHAGALHAGAPHARARPPRQALAPPAQHQPYAQDYPAPAPAPLYRLHGAGLSPPAAEGPARLLRAQTPEDSAGAPSQLAERPPDFGEYVDFGAHTGDHGAFGWYADYPINQHDSSPY